jgi:hypothetical protein
MVNTRSSVRPSERRDRRCRSAAVIHAERRERSLEGGACDRFQDGCRCPGCLKAVRDFKHHFQVMARRVNPRAQFSRDFVHRGRLLDWVLSKGTWENSVFNRAVISQPQQMFNSFNE